ncbi:Predicted ferric reductase [Klenkia soli]|uniref:Predicted ferric reductase n=1 Tax=Klenkia soli TaxID=1052260 RepID=A0A1H0IPB9_9ACTN|nr:ferric reductase-like transmembrane domain-containing protein [Klenkia soli]SDO33192.1 Predicted ferric reductase [Klenkia soli]
MTAGLAPEPGTARRPSPVTATRRRTVIDRATALTVAAIGALTVATWPIALATLGPAVSLLGIIAHVSGMLAGFGVLVLLLLMARTPALELGVGADVLARWHAFLGRNVIALVGVHGIAATAAWAQATGTGPLTAIATVMAMPWLPAATVGTVLMVVAGIASARAARRRIRHETWHALHLLMYLAVALSFGHMLAGPDLAGFPVLQIGWALAYMHVFALVLRYRVIAPIQQATRHRLRVAEIRPEGPGVVSIHVTGRHLHELDAESGQFFRWRFLTRHHWRNAHPFSLSAPPTSTSMRLTVKALGDGTQQLQRLPVGTRIAAEGPYGAVTAARRTHRNVLLIAGGVGITPMRALFESLPVAPGEDLLLLYRARNRADVLFADELEDIAARRGIRLSYVLTGDPRLSDPHALLHAVPDLADRDVYMCGSPGFTAAVRTCLREGGLPAGQLHEERFA